MMNEATMLINYYVVKYKNTKWLKQDHILN